MSFLAKLFLDNTERQILNADILVRQATDWLGRPESMPEGGQINIKIASTYETMFWDWMVSPIMLKEGYIRFYKHDGMSRLFDLEFWDCYCVDYYEFFDDSSNEPLELYLTLSPGVIRFKNTVFEKNWKQTNINLVHNKAQALQTEKSFDDFYVVDEKNNRITAVEPGMNIELVIRTSDCIGKSITIDLGDEKCNYKYKGNILKDDILSNYTINKNIERIPLEVIEQQ